jgi:filamentous hemagglutinin family protein
MKQKHHRVVFKPVRGLPRTVHWAIALAVSSPLSSPQAWSQILADPSAPGSQRPTILSVGGGVPLINITTPSAAGVSRNTYRQFDVGAPGAILNNSRTGAQSQLGGAVPGNPWLATGPARVILNEVNSSNPSFLNGPIEVAGQRAEVIVANPSGIQVNGSTFINASGVTLTTGTPVLQGGSLDAYIVQRGSVGIFGAGLDARGADYLSILSRATEVNAGLWANYLKVVNGANTVDASTHEPTGAAPPVGEPPRFLLDVAHLGGMYANHIFLVGTEKGLGVNNQGVLSAQGELVLLADGRLVNKGLLQGNAGLNVQASGIENGPDAQISGQQTVSLSTPGDLSNAGLIDGSGVSVQADVVHNSSRLYGDQLAIAADSVVNAEDAVIAAREHLSIQARDTISNQRGALILSAGDMALSADRIENRSARIEALGDLDIGARVLLNANEHLQTEVISDGGGTTTRTLYFTPSGEIDASDVAWMAVKPVGSIFGGGEWDEYSAHGRAWLFTHASAQALAQAGPVPDPVHVDPRLAIWYHGPEPYVAAGMVQVGSGDSQTEVWAEAQFAYTRDDPIWAALGITPPAGDAPGPMPRPISADNEVSGDTPQYREALEQWQAQAAPWVALGEKLTTLRSAINAELQPFDIYQNVTETRPALSTLHSEPGQILAGGNARLNIREQFTNQDSEVIAGGTLSALGVAANNQATQVQADITRTGTAYTWGVIGEDCLLGNFDCSPKYGWLESAVDQRIPTTLQVSELRHEQHASDAPSVSSGPSVNLGSALFQPVADPASGVLFQTDSNFTQQRRWTDAGAQLALLGLDPNTLQKRLGDGFLEQRLVREQIAQLTGQRFLGDYTSDDAQYLALLQAGATFAQAHQLRPGITLTAEQVAALTSDIVWLEAQEVTLPDGRTVTALVPRVYLMPREGDLNPKGALLAGREVHLDLSGDFLNSGSVAGRDLVLIDANGIRSSGRIASQGTTALKAEQDILIEGGEVAARHALLLDAGRDIKVASTSAQSTDGQAVVLDRVARLTVSDDAGILIASAGQDIELQAAGVQADVVDLYAERDLRLTTLNTREALDTTRDEKNYGRVQRSAEVGTWVGGGDVTLSAGQDVQMRSAQVQANGAPDAHAPYYERQSSGQLNIHAGRNLDITAGEASYQVEHGVYAKSSGVLGSSSTETRTLNSHTRAQGSALGGRHVNLSAGEDITIKGSHAIADEQLDVQAGGDVRVLSERTEYRQERFHEEKGSGLFGSGAGLTLGSQQQSSEQQSFGTGAQGSTLGALKGDVTVRAGGTYEQIGSDVLAPEGDIRVRAKNIRVVEARTTEDRWREDKMRQGGLTLGLGGGVVQMMQGTTETLQALGKTDDARLQALGVATAGMQLKQAIDTAGKAAASGKLADAGISVNISVGSSSSRSRSESTSNNAQGSRLTAGGEIELIAEGGGKDSDILIQGSELNAGTRARLKAEDKVELRAAENTTREKTESRNRSGSVGVGWQIGGGGAGVGFTASASSGKGNAEGESTTYTNTHVRAGEKVVIESGGDTVLAGAGVSADRVEADIGGDLLIESLQDRATYKERSQQSSASATVGAGGGGSFSASRTNIESEYASVGEQSGIRAGDGGFDVKVQGKTVLKGGAITSTQVAVDEQRNDFESEGGVELEDVHNEARYKASGWSAGAGVYVSDKKNQDGSTVMDTDGQPVKEVNRTRALGWGDDKGNASSTTRAGISGIAGQQDARTGDAQTGLAPIFDRERVNDEVNAQVTLRRNGLPVVAKGWGDQADAQRDELRKEAAQLDAGDPARAQLLAEADRWDEGGVYRATGHVVIGGLAGGTQGALGAGGASLAAPALNDLQHQMQTALQDAGMNTLLAQEAAGLGLAGGLAVVSGAAGGNAAAGAAFNTDVNNRQLHHTEKQRIRELADGKARATCRGDSACERDARLYWSDMLERVAESRVDAQAAADEQAYQRGVMSAAQRPGTEASMGGAERYFSDVGEAQRMLDADTGRVILDSQGKVVLGSDGKPQTYFSATQAQRDDPYGNVFPGGSPDNQVSVTPGKERRDAQRLQWMNTPNGQAVPDTTLEEALLGVRVPAKGAGAIARSAEGNAAKETIGEEPLRQFAPDANASSERAFGGGVDVGAESANASIAVRSKLSALENAQASAVRVQTLPDGRVRYYEAERAARTPGPSRGSSYVTEWNPATGNVRSWNEVYDQAGNVTRVHPKMINGQTVDSVHYPPTARELGRSK